MAYNRRNILQRMVDIQNITLEHTNKGVTQEHVFKTIIHPQYRICRKTFYSYLGSPAKMELKRLNNVEQQQMQLF
ncbi:hypothetical protein [Carboxylicivirga linearis]|uniref:Uncharacterized protein n=1 Tax=Carboxylicivirga linearis TaxID=1628157 RepID=A0ABS5K0I5_9BACT|nr:hypothetical protein [Carboxylicivirga linearis]MBS2100692.1 hypothetical protein [Carboxylicivirga linearis]